MVTSPQPNAEPKQYSPRLLRIEGARWRRRRRQPRFTAMGNVAYVSPALPDLEDVSANAVHRHLRQHRRESTTLLHQNTDVVVVVVVATCSLFSGCRCQAHHKLSSAAGPASFRPNAKPTLRPRWTAKPPIVAGVVVVDAAAAAAARRP